MKLKKETIQLNNGVKFDIWTDVGDMLEAALDNWLARREREELTAQNFCEYIESKGLHRAQTTAP